MQRRRQASRIGATTAGWAQRCWRALLRSGSEGGALMETAVVLPVFMMVLTGIYTFGIAYNNKIMLTNATTVAAQRLQQLRTSTSDPCLDTYNALLAAAPTLDSSKVTMSFTLAGTTFGSYTGSAITCTSGANYLTVGSTFTVSAYYPCTISAYAFSTSSCQLSATVSEYEY